VIRAYHSPHYAAELGDHIMPIQKFDRVRRAVVSEGFEVRVLEPEPVTDADLLRVHTEAYVRAIATGIPRDLAESQKFPWSPGLAESVRWTSGGCVAALEAALEDGIAANIASGFHHAHTDHGEGFCTFNGLVVAFDRARAEGRIRRALVVDLDVHYGNGTASLVASRPDFHNLSIYGSWYKDNRASSDVTSARAPDTANAWSIPVPSGASGEAYLAIVRAALIPALERARPDVILYQAGADPYREDPYSPLDVGIDDLLERDRFVFSAAHAAGIPIAWVLAGGYTADVSKIVRVHLNTFRAALDVFEAPGSGGVVGAAEDPAAPPPAK
jgi:acetoin utilization deacetylase AcuC-like enzyme